MSYLLRTKDDYRIYYGEPVYRFVVTNNGSYFSAEDFQKMIDNERVLENYILIDSENFPIDGWADIAENDHGIVISNIVAEYLLDGSDLDVDSWVELGKITS
jgi:hypothetical protein